MNKKLTNDKALELFNQVYKEQENGSLIDTRKKSDQKGRFLKNPRDVSCLKHKASVRFSRREEAYLEMYFTTTIGYLIKGTNLGIHDVTDFFCNSKIKTVIKKLKSNIQGNFFFKFEINNHLEPHIHIQAIVQDSKTIEKLKIEENPIDIYSDGFLKYLLKPDKYTKTEDRDKNTDESIKLNFLTKSDKIFLGHWLRARSRLKKRKLTCKFGLVWNKELIQINLVE
jgi:hypothetical protein